MTRKIRTKAAYNRLFDDRESLFPGVETLLFPNGASEIWFRTADGLGVRVQATNGKAGLGVTVSHFVGTPAIDAFFFDARLGHDCPHTLPDAVTEVQVVQYRQDARSQQFRGWYRKDVGSTQPEFDSEEK